MSNIAGWSKRRLLPLWNGGHRVAWRLGEYAGAVGDRRFERCAACGRWGPMLRRRWVIRPELARRWGLSPELLGAMARKESDACSACGAKLRARRLARVVLELYGGGAPSIRRWARSGASTGLRVAEINEVEGLHAMLAALPGLAYSEYLEGADAGDIVDGVRREDLQDLSYPDASFDLVLTSETLEHVPDLGRALAEVRRVLVPGGRHVFTVPLLPGVPETFARATRRPDGTIEHHCTPIAHPGGDWGYPVFNEFGADLPDLLRAAGFEVDLRFGPPRVEDVAQVFVCRRPDDG